ncbi:hypothetical protein DFJ73DRAFT_829477 [Zopfochytrium polystomum]|nr:hypothetical protein DFJ73DRAFT_829477 [Zopfochytrium polystomum]
MNNPRLDAVRREYRTALAELTFNSRPIIQNLTVIAGENLAAASAIVQAVEDQLRNASPRQKLPVLYLMDSICKNIGSTYLVLFAQNLFQSFTNAYSTVDPGDRVSFNKVVATWRSLDGRPPIFPLDVIQKLENFMTGFNQRRGSGSHIHVNPSFVGRPRPGPTQNATRPPFRGSHARFRHDGQRPTPAVAEARRREEADRRLVTTVVPRPPPRSLQDTQLSRLLVQQIQALLTHKRQITMANPLDGLSLSQIPILTELLEFITRNQLTATQMQEISQKLQSMQPTPVTPPSQLVSINTVVDSLVANAASPLLPLIPALPVIAPMPSGRSPLNLAPTPSRSTGKIHIPPIALTTEEINRVYPESFRSIYDMLKSHCKQCGARFVQDKSPKMVEHMDWHFRQNRRAKEKDRKAVSRGWYLTEDSWLKEKESGVTEASMQNLFFESATPAPLSKLDEVLASLPADDLVDLNCGICGERFDRYWNENDEQWEIKNALKVGDKVLHQTCYRDAGGSGSNPLKRLLPDGETVESAKRVQV